MISVHLASILSRTAALMPAPPPPILPPPSRTFPTPPPRQSLSGMPHRFHILDRTKWSSNFVAFARMNSNPDACTTSSNSVSVRSSKPMKAAMRRTHWGKFSFRSSKHSIMIESERVFVTSSSKYFASK